jgi:hypothetical protein
MTKLTAKNAHKLDLDTLNEDQLRQLASNLIRSRQDRDRAKEEKEKFIADQVKKQRKILSVMMPQIATLIEALADRAGLGDDPSVRRTVEMIGDQTYTQWSGPVEDLPTLSLDAEPAGNPRAGDAEMVLSSKIDQHIQTLNSALDFGDINGHIAKAVRGLIDGIDAHMEEAIANGFKAHGVDWKPVPMPTTRKDIDVNPASLHELLSDLAKNVDFGTQILRLDLRSAMYRELTSGLCLASVMANDLYFQQIERSPVEAGADGLAF